MIELQGKIAVITGASSGIGSATALALSQHGAEVVLVARREAQLQTLVSQIQAQGGKAQAILCDLTNDASLEQLQMTLQNQLPHVDMLVNNAGVMLLGTVLQADATEWDRMLNLNLRALLRLTQSVLPSMRAMGSGHIVNISSVAGRVANTGMAVYNATKFGVTGFSDALRQEVGKFGIRVTTVEPGMVRTELTDHVGEGRVRENVQALYESMEILEPEDVAAAIVFAVTQPARVNINEILLRPTQQTSII